MAKTSPGPAPVSDETVGALETDVSVRTDRWTEALPDAAGLCRRAAAAAFAAVQRRPGPAEASVVLADDAFVQDLNKRYRDTDSPTNVLAFPGTADDAGAPEGAPVILGDVIVAFETAAAEAEAADKALGDHLSHLVVHGMLHLMGHDHLTAADADAMERLETEVLAGLGVADPYQDQARPETGGGT